MSRTFAFVLAFAACGEPPNILPNTGTWGFHTLQYDDDACNFRDEFPSTVLAAAVFEMEALDSGGAGDMGQFTMSNALLEEPVFCDVLGYDFGCERIEMSTAMEWPEDSDNTGTPDAVRWFDAHIVGSFDTTYCNTEDGCNRGEMSMTVTSWCVGNDCEALGLDNNITSCDSSISGEIREEI